MTEANMISGTMIFISLSYYMIYKIFKEKSEQDVKKQGYYSFGKIILNCLSQLFQQLFIINTVNVVSGAIVYFSEIGTFPLVTSFLQGHLTILLLINNIYICIMIVYLIASFFDTLKELVRFKKGGGLIKW